MWVVGFDSPTPSGATRTGRAGSEARPLGVENSDCRPV